MSVYNFDLTSIRKKNSKQIENIKCIDLILGPILGSHNDFLVECCIYYDIDFGHLDIPFMTLNCILELEVWRTNLDVIQHVGCKSYRSANL